MFDKFFSELSDTKKKILSVVVVVLVVGLFYQLLLAPSLKRVEEIDQQIVQEQKAVQKNMDFLSSRDQIVKEASAFKDYFTTKTRSEEQVIAELLKNIESLSKKSKIKTSKISPAGKEYNDQYLMYSVEVDASGTLEDLTQFMYTITTSKELLKVDTFSLSGNAKDLDKVRASFKVSQMIIGADPSVEAKKLVLIKEDKQSDDKNSD